MTVKFEKITLWTATETYGHDGRGISALDYIIQALNNLEGGCQILDHDGEDYKLVKVRKGKKHA
jgi:hypothetical protein